MATNSERDPIAFVCAMPIELAPLVRMLSLTETEVNGTKMHAGTLDGRAVVAIVTGMGTQLASEATPRLFDAATPRWLLALGITAAPHTAPL
jgi:nucleoside phosphorylase